MRRVLRVTLRLAVIAGIGAAIAVAIRKLTAPPAEPIGPLEPWPPLSTGAGSEAVDAARAAEAAADAAETAAEGAVAAAVVADEAALVAEEAAGEAVIEEAETETEAKTED